MLPPSCSFFLILTFLLALPSLSAQELPPLRIADNGTHLETKEGKPFFYLADTAWELLHRLDKKESRAYLTKRAADGFNVIQTVVLAELEGLKEPNANGDLPLIDQDPTQPNEDYFRHIDEMLALADSLGLYLGLLPSWGDKFNLKWGVGPEVFTPENARTYGAYLGKRYRGKSIIWILGGDRNPEEAEDFAIIRAMAAGLRSVIGKEQLITYHPQGGYCSADFFAEDEWIDFHMFQTGHGCRNDKANYDQPRKTLRKVPTKPVINGEPAYEDHPINWRPVNGWFDDWDTRQAAYWSVFSSTKGHTFGNHNIWQMWAPEHEAISSARTPWWSALHYPGAPQMGHLRRLMEEYNFPTLKERLDLIPQGANSSGREQLCLAAVSSSTSGIATSLVYTPYGDQITIDATTAGWTKMNLIKARWFNPRTGAYIPAQPVSTTEPIWQPPFAPQRGNDWVLVLEYNP